MTHPFWAGRSVVVTGHTGFKGAWLSLWLAELGARVTGYALAPDGTPSLFEQAGVGARIHSVIGDIRDLERVQHAVREAQPSVIFHLAAQALVRRSYQQPIETFGVNVLGSAHVLEAARVVPSVRSVVMVTTDKCYENREWPWGYREDDALGGHDPYASSKACAELVTQSYRRALFPAGGAGVATARAGNVIGGGDWSEDRIIPDLVRSAERREPVVVRNPKSTRPWQHVLDVLHGYLVLGERLHDEPAAYAEAWNFGPAADDVHSVEALARMICEQWSDVAWRHEPGQHPHEARALTLDAAKARARLGWRPRLPLADTVRWTVDWYRAAAARQDLAAATTAQLRRYLELAS